MVSAVFAVFLTLVLVASVITALYFTVLLPRLQATTTVACPVCSAPVVCPAPVMCPTCPVCKLLPREPTSDEGYSGSNQGAISVPKPGYYDVQNQGAPNDFCRWVGGTGPNGAGGSYWSCSLAGTTNQYSPPPGEAGSISPTAAVFSNPPSS